jgi:hypothetical protein
MTPPFFSPPTHLKKNLDMDRYMEPCPKKRGLTTALNLEARPIRCVRGLKPSLVIGQMGEIGSNPFTPRGWADLLV